jgi:Tfp pilus assembly protein PilF
MTRILFDSDRGRAIHLSAIVAVAAVVAMGCGNKESAEEPLERGDEMLFANEPHQAIPFYDEAISIDPKCKKAYLCRAMAYLELERPERALEDFSKAIEIDPEDSYPYEQRAKIYREVLKNEAKAKADEQIAEAIRQRRWSDLQNLRKKP